MGIPETALENAARSIFARRDGRGIELDGLLGVAFDKSWRFVARDPFLAHHPQELLRSRLQTLLETSVNKGERDLLRLANGAIWTLRKEFEKRS